MQGFDIKASEKFFFLAMINGWASGGKLIPLVDMPFYRGFVYSQGDFRLLDRWSNTSGSDKSFGETTIWFCSEPVWAMHYEGFYKKEAIPILRSALLEAYRQHQFRGGRGVSELRLGDLLYENHPDPIEFSLCKGHEMVRRGEDILGQHEYRGMLLI